MHKVGGGRVALLEELAFEKVSRANELKLLVHSDTEILLAVSKESQGQNQSQPSGSVRLAPLKLIWTC